MGVLPTTWRFNICVVVRCDTLVSRRFQRLHICDSSLRLGLGREIINTDDASNCRRTFMLICDARVRVIAAVVIFVFEFSV